MRIAIIGDAHSSGGGAATWAYYFANKMKSLGHYVEYIGDKNHSESNKLSEIAIQSIHNSKTDFNNLKTPAEVLGKLYNCQKRLYEQLQKKIYDAYIVQRMDFLPVLQSFNLTNKVGVWIPNHDISIYESLIKDEVTGTESPYRLLEMNRMFMQSKQLNFISSSEKLAKTLTDFNPNISTFILPIEINSQILETNTNPFDQTKGVLWIGSATSYKNPALMMSIVEDNPNIPFTMIFNTTSKGELTKIEKQYKAKNLTVKGAMPLTELIEEYKKHRIGIVTSNVETFCIVAQEHLAFHPTFICSKNLSGYQDIFPPALKFANKAEAKSLFQLYYNNEEFYNTKITEQRQFLFDHFSSKPVARAYEQFADLLLKQRQELSPFRSFNTFGDYIKSKVGFMKEVEYFTVINGLKYQDAALSQHSVLTQLNYFNKIEKEDGTYFSKKE